MNYRPYSATEAIAPGFARGRELLFRNFRVGRLLKLGFFACIATAGGGLSVNLGQSRLSHGAQMSAAPPALFAAAMVVMGVIMVIVELVVLYVSARLLLSLLWVIVSGDTRVGPKWERSARPTWRLCGAELIVAIPMAILIACVAFVGTMSMMHRMSDLNGAGVFVVIKGFAGFFLALLAVALLLHLLLLFVRDFMMPAMAVEDASIGLAWRRATEIYGADPGQCTLFMALRLLLQLACAVAGYIVILIVMGVTALLLWGLGTGITAVLPHNPMVKAMVVGLCVAIGLVWLVLVMIAVFGSLLFLLQNYATLFIGSRYAPLGNLIWPPAPPVMPPPASPNPERLPPGGGAGAPPMGGQDDWLTAMG